MCGNIITKSKDVYRRTKSDKDLSELFEKTSLRHPATFIRKDSYEKYGLYSLKYKCAMDRELFLRYYINGAKFQIVDVDVNLFTTEGGISTIDPRKTAYPEDYMISIEYGVDKKKAEKILRMRNKQYYYYNGNLSIHNVVYCILKKINILNIVRKLTHKDFNILTDEEIIKLKINTYSN